MTVVSRYAQWFDESGLPFFKHYTDHTTQHSLDVFRTAIQLIPEESFDVITAADIAVLLIACFCHDAGMHLTEDQFLILVADKVQPDNGIDKENWAVLWQNFLKEARRFNQATLEAIFGDNHPVKVPPQRPIDFSNRDRLLIGEFLRRNHPRLAQDISLRLSDVLGVLDLTAGLSDVERDLVGLVARSHGMNVRDTLPYVERKFDKRVFQSAHVTYLMILLRIADYAQIQSARAPLIHNQIHRVTSPTSLREWRVHQSIVNIHNFHDDPEAIFVDARPQEILDLERVRDWLRDLQRELDLSWAILGEIYGRHQTELGLKVRRIRSNALEDGRQYPFLPNAFSFRVAEAEMLSLLLAPLYGDHPLYGVRELVQNGRDAILERSIVGTSVPRLLTVTIDGRPEACTVTIVDSGIGMTPEIIGGYFLNAGASYRYSQEWKSENTDDEGKAKISRSGRFGVGALAAFLIGDRMEVVTRHHNSATGLQFDCRLHDKAIEIREVDASVGTTIKVFSNEKTMREIVDSIPAFETMFSFNDVEFVVFTTDTQGKTNKVGSTEFKPKAPKKEIRFATKLFLEVLCNIEKSTSYGDPQGRDYVNGIAIASVVGDKDVQFGGSIYNSRTFTNPVLLPGHSYAGGIKSALGLDIRVEDRDALYPVNLSRTLAISRDLEVTQKIDSALFAIYQEEISSWKTAVAKSPEGSAQVPVVNGYFGIGGERVIYLNGDVLMNDADVLRASQPKYVVRLSAAPHVLLEKSKKYPDTAFYCASVSLSGKGEAMQFFRNQYYAIEQSYKNGCSIVLLRESYIANISSNMPNWLSKKWSSKSTVVHGGHEKIIMTFGISNSDIHERFENLLSEFASSNIELYSAGGGSYLWRRWKEQRHKEQGVFSQLHLAIH